MSGNAGFIETLQAALAQKEEWLNAHTLPKMLDNYRLLDSCVRNTFDAIEKRDLITPDSYKLDKKISDVEAPEDAPFPENEVGAVIGQRLSDFESMLDFICTYVKFSVDSFDLQRIKKLQELHNSFQWNNLTQGSPSVNTSRLAGIINEVRRGANQITQSVLNDCLANAKAATNEITGALQEITLYQRECYKLKVRAAILESPSFNNEKAATASEKTAEIRRLFPSALGKAPFYTALISEIIQEDAAEDKEKALQGILEKLKIKNVEQPKKKDAFNPKSLLIDAVLSLSALSPTYAAIAEKLSGNVQLLEKQKNTAFQKFRRIMRRAFNLKELPVMYNLILVDEKSQAKTMRRIDIYAFISGLERRSKMFSVLFNRNSLEYKKISNAQDNAILQFLGKQISENQETLVILAAADEYFKSSISHKERAHIKGLKIDLVTVKNAIIRTNQKRTEYCSYIEEIEQMKTLGIMGGN